jgi:glycosyltransferase involved in cell wall biosynthesis
MAQKEVVVFAPLVNRLPVDGYGAVERVTLERVKYLKILGYKVQLVANAEDPSLADEILSPERLFKFPKSEVENLRWFLSFKWTTYMSSFSRFSRQIWEAPILSDASAMDPFNNYFLANSLGRERVLYYLHGNHYLTNGIGKPFFYPLDAITKASLKVNYGALNTRLSDFLKIRGFRCSYMPNGMDFLPVSKAIREHSGYFLFVGKITKEKAPHLAIEIAEKLGIPLKIVGPVSDKQYFDTEIRTHLNDNINYLGELPRNILNDVFSEAAALLFTSQWNDPQGIVVLEAMSRGVPVIALNTGYFSGSYDMIKNFENGFMGTLEEILMNAETIINIDRLSIYTETKQKWSWEQVLKTYHVPVMERMRKDYES